MPATVISEPAGARWDFRVRSAPGTEAPFDDDPLDAGPMHAVGARNYGAHGSPQPPLPAGSSAPAAARYVQVCLEVLNGFRPPSHLRTLTGPVEFDDILRQLRFRRNAPRAVWTPPEGTASARTQRSGAALQVHQHPVSTPGHPARAELAPSRPPRRWSPCRCRTQRRRRHACVPAAPASGRRAAARHRRGGRRADPGRPGAGTRDAAGSARCRLGVHSHPGRLARTTDDEAAPTRRVSAACHVSRAGRVRSAAPVTAGQAAGAPWQRLYFLPEPHGHGALRDGPLPPTTWPGAGIRAPADMGDCGPRPESERRCLLDDRAAAVAGVAVECRGRVLQATLLGRGRRDPWPASRPVPARSAAAAPRWRPPSAPASPLRPGPPG